MADKVIDSFAYR